MVESWRWKPPPVRHSKPTERSTQCSHPSPSFPTSLRSTSRRAPVTSLLLALVVATLRCSTPHRGRNWRRSQWARIRCSGWFRPQTERLFTPFMPTIILVAATHQIVQIPGTLSLSKLFPYRAMPSRLSMWLRCRSEQAFLVRLRTACPNRWLWARIAGSVTCLALTPLVARSSSTQST